ncbi:unnamed protein product [Trichobilharzia regenti]|nr:unnamed protein product [Trichobilharzia regenti]
MNGINVSILRAITTRQKRLTIRNKQLRHLTNSVGFLDWLVVLDLRSNNLSTLPILLPRNLEVINLGNNVFTDIPEAVYELTLLKSISIYNNRLQSIPSLLFGKDLVSLKYLSMSHNALKALPDSIVSNADSHLEYLNLGYNQILILPFNIHRLQRMKTLILHKNFLSRLPEVGNSASKTFISQNNQVMKCKNLLLLGKKGSEILYPLRNVFCSYQCLKATDNCYGLAIA